MDEPINNILKRLAHYEGIIANLKTRYAIKQSEWDNLLNGTQIKSLKLEPGKTDLEYFINYSVWRFKSTLSIIIQPDFVGGLITLARMKSDDGGNETVAMQVKVWKMDNFGNVKDMNGQQCQGIWLYEAIEAISRNIANIPA